MKLKSHNPTKLTVDFVIETKINTLNTAKIVISALKGMTITVCG